MRWQALFDDLQAQAEAADAAALASEVRDRTRREAALVRTVDRLRAAVGVSVTLHVEGAGPVPGVLLDAGPDWVLLEDVASRDLLVPSAALLGVGDLPLRAERGAGAVEDRLDVRWVLRRLARDRAPLCATLRDGSRLHGTLDRVGADHVDLAEHPPGEPRRPSSVRGVRLVPIPALALLRAP